MWPIPVLKIESTNQLPPRVLRYLVIRKGGAWAARAAQLAM